MGSGPPGSVGIPKPTIEEILRRDLDHRCPEGHPCVRVSAVAELPTRFGEFQVVAFHAPFEEREHAALVKGDITHQENVPVRLHSECLTGDTFGSLRCDCRDQLELALTELARRPLGALLYLRQEGRGIGLENKIKAYQLQEWGYDTVEANQALGFRADERDYGIAAHMLRSLSVESIELMSNNPDKIRDLTAQGIRVNGRIPIEARPNPHNRRYLETKRVKAGHLLSSEIGPGLDEQVDCLHRTANPARPPRARP